MKKFIFISAALSIIILVFFAVKLNSKTTDEKVKAFNESIKLESDGKIDKAIEPLLKIYNTNKENYLINIRLGWLYCQKKDYSRSKDYYSEAVRLNSKSIDAKLGLTLPLSALNEWNRIKDLYLDILKTNSMDYTANLRLGQIYLQNGNYDNAKKHIEIAYNSFPSYYEPNLSLGWTYYYLGNREKAKLLLTQALMLSKGDKLAAEGLKLLE